MRALLRPVAATAAGFLIAMLPAVGGATTSSAPSAGLDVSLAVYAVLTTLGAIVVAALTQAIGHRRRIRKQTGEREFREAIDSMADGFVLLDAQDCFVTWNRSYAALVPDVIEHLRPGMSFRDGAAIVIRRRQGLTDAAEIRAAVDARIARRLALGVPFDSPRPGGGITQIVERRTRHGGIVINYRDVTAERVAARQVAEARAQADAQHALLREAVELIPDTCFVLDTQDRLMLWNSAYEAMFEHLRGHLRVGMTLRDVLVIHAASPLYDVPLEEREAWVARALHQLDPSRPQQIRRLSDGRILRGLHRRMPSGGMMAIVADVTAQTNAAEKLAAAKLQAELSEALFRDGIDGMVDGFMLLDAEDRIVTWNKAYERLFVVGAQVVRRGMTFAEYVRASQTLRWQRDPSFDLEAAIAARLKDHGPSAGTHEMIAVSGQVVQIIERPTSIGGTVIVFREITAERRALEAMTASSAEFRDGIESMLDGFAQFDADLRLMNWNERYLRIFPNLIGQVVRGMTYRRIMELNAAADLYAIPVGQRPAWIDGAVAAVVENEELSITRDLTDGRVIWASVTRTAAGGAIFVIRDITERRREESQLAEALEREREVSAQQRRFIAIAAHEFRTPLTIIDGAAQRLARYADSLAPADLRERADKIRGAVARMSQLVDTTLNSAKLDAGQIEMTVVTLDLATLVESVCRRLEGLAPGFQIAVAPTSAPIVVDGDARLLEQVVTNLASNAVKYSGQSRRVDIRVECRGAQACVIVQDYGIGVPADEVAKLFTRFFRATTARGLSGTGIGLNLVKELAVLHGGTITVESAVGVGSTFVLALPLSASRVVAAGGPAPAPRIREAG